MKVQELLEARINPAAQIGAVAKGLKGVRVYEPTQKKLDDVDGNPYPEAYTVRVVYKAARGKPGTETIYVYRTNDGDWGYSSETENKELGELTDLLAELHNYLKVGARFYATSASLKEEKAAGGTVFYVHVPANVYSGKYYDYQTVRVKVLAADEQEAAKIVNSHKKEVIELVAKMKTHGGKKMVPADTAKNVFFKDSYYARPARLSTPVSGADILTKDGIGKYKVTDGKAEQLGESHGHDLELEAKRLKRQGDMVAYHKQVVVEGYESKVLKVLKAAGITDAYFEKGTLFLQTKDDWKQATRALQAADEINQLPSMEYLG